MTLDLIVRGGTLVTPGGVRRADLGITDGVITEIAEELTTPARKELGAAGRHLFPGVVDAHVHLNEPGRADWEGFTTGTRALAAGGATTFVDMPLNSSPPVLGAAELEAKRALGEQKSLLDFALWGGLTPVNLDRLDELAQAGAAGFKAFMSDSGLDEFPAADEATLRAGLEAARRHGLVVAVHAESYAQTRRLSAQARAGGARGVRDYLRTRPVEAELEAVALALALAGETGAALHLVHLSSGEAVALAAEARAQGVDVTAETCPHYLHFTDTDVERVGAALKCAPPLRPAAVQGELWARVLAGDVQIVGSDHSPAPPSMKTSDDFFELWGGVSGAQSTLNVLLTDGHAQRGLGLAEVAALSALNPARRFGLAGKGALEVGMDADFALVALDEAFVLEELHDRWRQNPYRGKTFRGRVEATYLRGAAIYAQGQFVGEPRGSWRRPGDGRQPHRSTS